MKFFLDTGSIDEIKKANDLGILDGVTTNPSLLAKEKKPYFEILREITGIVKGPISAEVTATDTDGMLREGRAFAKIAENIVVKIPIIKAGVPAIKQLTAEGIAVNVTLCFSASQALIAAKAGASYISPFIGRFDDVSTEGMALIQDVVTIYSNYGFKTEVLVASVRHPMHVVQAALIGADVCTMPFSVFDKLLNHPLTDIGLKNFLSDWEKAKGK
jgi:transaldolase